MIALPKAMYGVIPSYVDKTFDDISEESEKKTKHFERFIVTKPLWRVPSQGIVE